MDLDDLDDLPDPELDEADEDLDDLPEDPGDEPEEPTDDLDAPLEPAPQRSRGENRVAAATRIAKEAKERSERLERQLQEALSRPAASAPRETIEQRRAKIDAETFDPVERLEKHRQLDREEVTGAFQALRFQTDDANDRAAYAEVIAGKNLAPSLKKEVEERLTAMRRQGFNAPRETVLKNILGERALERAGAAKTRQSRQAEGRREQQSASPPRARSDAPAGEGRRTSEQAARNRRLSDMQI